MISHKSPGAIRGIESLALGSLRVPNQSNAFIVPAVPSSSSASSTSRSLIVITSRHPKLVYRPCAPIDATSKKQKMASEIAAFENDIKEYRLQLETIQLGLQNDPDNTELQSLKAEIEEGIALLESTIAELRPAPEPTKPTSTASKEKWSKEQHPAYQAGYRKSEVEADDSHAQTSFAVNDTVTARWRSGDGGFYTARIQSITGSKNDPVYIVKFPKYGTVETLKSKDIKPLSVEAKKRKADVLSGSSTPVATPTNSSVISAAASVDPTLAQQVRKEPSKVSDGPARPAKIPKKVKANKELEAGKGKWQDFVAKGKGGKMAKKDSMFRTGESFTARGESRSSIRQRSGLTILQWDSRVPAKRCGKMSIARGIFTTRATPSIEESSLGVALYRCTGMAFMVTMHDC